jgi:hypothetical protein
MLKFSEQELKEYAEKQAETIVIRSYKNGCSSDNRRKSTDKEKKIIENIIYGGLLGIRWGHGNNKETDAIIDACEFIGNLQMKELVNDGEMNGYDTIYLPLQNWVQNNLK